MSSTTTRSAIGGADIEWYDGATATFTRLTSTGGQLTLNKIGNEIDVAEAYGAGTASYAALQTAIGTIGSNQRTLVLKPGTWSITSSLTIPSNLTLKVSQGSILAVATTKTLTINGPIEAGPYQIFSWAGTGAFDLSGCPNKDYYLEWFGAQTGTSNNCSPALQKAHDSLISGATLWISPGLWQLDDPVAFSNTWGFTLSGVDPIKSILWINVGTSDDGLTIGVAGYKGGSGTDANVYNYYVNNLSIGGETDCCIHALVFSRSMSSGTKCVNVTCGSTSYSIVHGGTENFDAEYYIGGLSGFTVGEYGLTCGVAVGGLWITSDYTEGWLCNTLNNFKIHKSGSLTSPTNPGIFLDGVGGNLTVTGDIENVSDGVGTYNYAIFAQDCINIRLEKLFLENCLGIGLQGCKRTQLTTIDTNGSPILIANCTGTVLSGTDSSTLTVDPASNGTMLISAAIRDENGLVDLAGDTFYGDVHLQYSYPPQIQFAPYGENRDNYITNAMLTRWTADEADGWADSTLVWTKCSGTQVDGTTAHAATYYAKIETDGADGLSSYTLTAEQLLLLKGTRTMFSLWANLPSQTFAGNSAWLTSSVTLPSWADATVYYPGQGVVDGSGNAWICTTGGTSDSSVSWPSSPHQGQTHTDNTVVWTMIYTGSGSQSVMPMVADGTWQKLSITQYIPWNATAVAYIVNLKQQDSAVDSVVYISEPCLNVGSTATRGTLPGKTEFVSHIQITANKHSYGTAVPASGWCQQGDIVWRTDATTGQHPGWICTTSGTGGGTAVWKAMANVA